MPESVISIRDVVGFILGKKPEDVTVVEEATEMLVIGAGLPRTGSTSLRQALHRLGLKSYHMKMAMMMDTKLWYQHGLERLEGGPGIHAQIVDAMAHQGYTATVDAPNCLYYKDLMQRYPKVKVILGIRVEGGGESFATSFLNTIARFGPIFHRVPFKWLPAKAKLIHEWLFTEMGCPEDPITHMSNYQCLVDLYEDWVQQVQEFVPADNLLVFKATDGWKPLCDFLSPLDPTIERNCQQVLQNEEPFPFVNDTAAMQATQNVFHWVAMMFENGPTLFVFGCLVWWMVAKTKPTSSNARPRRKAVKQKRN